MIDEDDNLCSACKGSGGNDYPAYCMTCEGRGYIGGPAQDVEQDEREDERDDGECGACHGSGGGDYPCACPSCGGSGRARQRSGYDFGDAEGRDYADEPCDAEVCW